MNSSLHVGQQPNPEQPDEKKEIKQLDALPENAKDSIFSLIFSPKKNEEEKK